MTRPIDLVIAPRLHDIDGMMVRRVLPFAKRRAVGPVVFFDHIGPARFQSGQGLDVRSHPHIGLATVTWVLEGAIDHRDSLGTHLTIRPGAVNWMTAGREITHSERTPAAERAAGQVLHAIQIWVALPQSHSEMEPEFRHVPASDIPVIATGGITAHLIAGEAFGARAPVDFPAPICIASISSVLPGRLDLPTAGERAIYAISGDIRVNGTPLEAQTMAVLEADQPAAIELGANSHAMLVGGGALDGERYMDWNFVAASKERLQQARDDWRASIAGHWSGTPFIQPPGEVAWIPLPGDPQPDPMDTPPT